MRLALEPIDKEDDNARDEGAKEFHDVNDDIFNPRDQGVEVQKNDAAVTQGFNVTNLVEDEEDNNQSKWSISEPSSFQ